MKVQVMFLNRARMAQLKALTLPELVIIVGCLTILVGLLLPTFARGGCGCGGQRINCTNNLKQIHLAFQTWSLDNGDRFPMQVSVTNGGTMELIPSGVVFIHFEVMSNELNTPKVLHCTEDKLRTNAVWFRGGMSDRNISYFINPDASTNASGAILTGDDNLLVNGSAPKPGLLHIAASSTIAWSKSRHRNRGNIGFADGSVQQVKNPRLAEALRSNGSPAPRLLLP